MVGKPCQSRYVKFLWLETSVFSSHSGLFLMCQQLVPHLVSLSLPWLLFSPMSVLWDTLPHLNPFHRKGLTHSFSDGLSRSSPVDLLQGPVWTR